MSLNYFIVSLKYTKLCFFYTLFVNVTFYDFSAFFHHKYFYNFNFPMNMKPMALTLL